MRKTMLLLAALSLCAPALAAAPGTAQNFLERANRLKAEAMAAGKSIGDDRIAAQKTGGPILYCSPKPRAQLGSFEFIDGLQAIPPAERVRMTLKQGMLRVLQKKYPCRR